jgi:hypothetical protein
LTTRCHKVRVNVLVLSIVYILKACCSISLRVLTMPDQLFLHRIYFFLSYETSYLNEEVNCTDPSPSVGVPWQITSNTYMALFENDYVTQFSLISHTKCGIKTGECQCNKTFFLLLHHNAVKSVCFSMDTFLSQIWNNNYIQPGACQYRKFLGNCQILCKHLIDLKEFFKTVLTSMHSLI